MRAFYHKSKNRVEPCLFEVEHPKPFDLGSE